MYKAYIWWRYRTSQTYRVAVVLAQEKWQLKNRITEKYPAMNPHQLNKEIE